MRFVYALVLAVVLSGCFHIDSLLTVRPDGSATLRDEVTLSGMALMALMETEDDEGSPFDEAAMEARAEALGEGVRVASFEPREDGYTVVFDVDDVRQLRYATPEALGENEGEGPDGVVRWTDGLAVGSLGHLASNDEGPPCGRRPESRRCYTASTRMVPPPSCLARRFTSAARVPRYVAETAWSG